MFEGDKGAQLPVLNHGKTLVLLICLIQLIFKPHGGGGTDNPDQTTLISASSSLCSLSRCLQRTRKGHFVIQEIMSVVLKQGFWFVWQHLSLFLSIGWSQVNPGWASQKIRNRSEPGEHEALVCLYRSVCVCVVVLLSAIMYQLHQRQIDSEEVTTTPNYSDGHFVLIYLLVCTVVVTLSVW